MSKKTNPRTDAPRIRVRPRTPKGAAANVNDPDRISLPPRPAAVGLRPPPHKETTKPPPAVSPPSPCPPVRPSEPPFSIAQPKLLPPPAEMEPPSPSPPTRVELLSPPPPVAIEPRTDPPSPRREPLQRGGPVSIAPPAPSAFTSAMPDLQKETARIQQVESVSIQVAPEEENGATRTLDAISLPIYWSVLGVSALLFFLQLLIYLS